ncbi:MAG TPA: arginine deiminase family protein [Streptosporangiaceae bacterium]
MDSEIGQLRTVLAHRPGAELKRLTPRDAGRLLEGFPGLPWVTRAQQEHDMLAQILRDHGVEVLYLMELLQDTLEYPQARADAVDAAVSDPGLGEQLRACLRGHLSGLDPEALAQVLVAGLGTDEFPAGRGLVYGLLDRHGFVLDPLPNLVFTGDSSVWIGPAVAVASLSSPARRRESALAGIVYRHHPRFVGLTVACLPGPEPLHGADILQLAPRVVAVGIGEQTSAAGVERLARRLFELKLADSVLAVPMSAAVSTVTPTGAHLDIMCTVVDAGTLLMNPGLAYLLCAHTITPGQDGLSVSRPQPFLEAAAQAMGVDAVTVISTAVSPDAASRQQWDDGGNALVIGPRLVVSHERHTLTHARLADAGIEVIKVPGSELGSGRGGPRCMSCPVSRAALAAPELPAPPAPPAEVAHAATERETIVAAPVPALIPAATSALG